MLMRLNMHMIADNLDAEIIRKRFSDKSLEPCLLQAKLYGECIDLVDRYLYIIEKDHLPKGLSALKGLHFVVLGETDDSALGEHEVIYIKDDISLLKLLDSLQQVFEKYNLWEEELNKILNDDADINKMCLVSKRIFLNPIMVHDGTFEIIAYNCEDSDMAGFDMDYSEEIGSYVVSPRLINCFKMEQLYADTMSETAAANYHAPHMSYDVLYVNLTGEESFPGRIIIPEKYGTNPLSAYIPLEILGKAVSTAINQRNALSRGYRRGLVRMFTDILDGYPVDSGYAEFCLHSKHWSAKDCYCCLKINLGERDLNTRTVSFNCRQLEEILGDALAFPYNDSIVCVKHLDADSQEMVTVGTDFGGFLRDGFYKAGISDKYSNIFETDSYYLQADAALAMGNEYDPDIWYYHFRNYAMAHLIYHGIGNMRPELFCDEAIWRLKRISSENVDYCETLRVYLENNMNLLHSAEALFIHRTTMFYRLNKIKEVIGEDLNDKHVRLKLLMSFFILDITKGGGSEN